MKPYGERAGGMRGEAKARRVSKPGGSYDMSRTERARIHRRPRKGERQRGRKETRAQL